MSRYDWSKAPSWAKAIATDSDGNIFAYESEPVRGANGWEAPIGGWVLFGSDESWADSLELRPTEIDNQWPDAVERPGIPPMEMSA